jgi:hypothetical protein
MVNRIALFLILSLGAAVASAQQNERRRESSAELALSNDTLELRYIGGGNMVGANRSSQVDGAFFLSEDRDIVLSAGLLFPTYELVDRLSIMIGPQVYAALLNPENNDVLSITLGLQARYVLLNRLGLAISGKAFYGPDILTFGAGDKLTDFSARAELPLAPRVMAFAGMRWFKFDLTEGSGSRTLQKEIFVGARYRF